MVSDRAERFDEARVSQKAHPLAHAGCDFDWDAIDRAFGEGEERAHQERLALADALGVVVRWAVGPLVEAVLSGRASNRAQRTVGRTMMVLAWTLNAETFGGQSLEQIAAILRINLRHLRELRSKLVLRFGQLRSVY